MIPQISGLEEATERMRAAQVAEPAIEVFKHHWLKLQHGDDVDIHEGTIRPVGTADTLHDLSPDADTAALARTAIIKLNGGLGTSMGMDRAKSLLEVRQDATFLDLIVRQVRYARERTGAALPLVLMHSFNTRKGCLSALAQHPDLPVPGIRQDFLQSQQPKIRTDDLTPVQWPADPALEWCPPGHGDIYVSLLSSGMLDDLLDAGFRYAFVSNADNVGAAPSAAIADWFARRGAAFAMEVCRRTPADRKGGHLALRIEDNRLILRELAQVAPEDRVHFADIERHHYFNTNNLWLDLRQAKAALEEHSGVLGLPLIRNDKHVDPNDPTSTPVIQVESAMGAAIEIFDGATAIEVPRSRFRPVKSTEDLLLLRSDAFRVADDGTLDALVDPLPLITLNPNYRGIRDFNARFPFGPPSLKNASSFTINGDWTFGRDVVVEGHVELPDNGKITHVSDGTVLSG